MTKKDENKRIIITIIIVTVVAVIGYGIYKIQDLKRDNNELIQKIIGLENKLREAGDKLANLQTEKEGISAELEEKTERVNTFDEDINKVIGEIQTIEKIQNTDPELLQKYSKVYFLNEHYIPEQLANINEKYLANGNEQIHTKIWPYLEDLLKDAENDGINLRVVSAYRDFNTQGSLKNQYTVQYGFGANTFSADQGFSEHQLGTTVDFSTAEIGSSFANFESTEAYEWLGDNAHKYGFTLSYPKGNEFYVFEPWHWRFVGRDLALDLQRNGESFYDVDQREIDEYIVNFFD